MCRAPLCGYVGLFGCYLRYLLAWVCCSVCGVFFGVVGFVSVCVLGAEGVSDCALASVWRCFACALMLFSVRFYVG